MGGFRQPNFSQLIHVDVCAINVSTRQIDECVRTQQKVQLKPPTILPISSAPSPRPQPLADLMGIRRKGLTLGIDNNCWKLPKVTKTAVSIAAAKPTHHTAYTHPLLPPPSPTYSASPLWHSSPFLITRRASGLLSLSNKQQQQQRAQPFRTL